MAADFWQSSHCSRWLVDRSRVFRSNPKDVEFFGNRSDIKLLTKYFMDCQCEHHWSARTVISYLGARLNVRQRVIATAQVFFRRFYLSASFREYDPRLVAPTCIFVAAKVEECAVNAKILLQKLNKSESSLISAGIEGTNIRMPSPSIINLSAPSVPTSIGPPHSAAAAAASSSSTAAASASPVPPASSYPFLYDMDDLLEMEFALLVGLKYDLIVWHPYRPLVQFLSSELNLPECLQMAHEVVNDVYRTDLPLLHPPYLLAIAAVYITCNFQEKEYKDWFNKLNVKQETIVEISRDLLHLWDEAESYCSATSEAKLLSLLRKLNERNYVTASQHRAQLAGASAAHSPAIDNKAAIALGSKSAVAAPHSRASSGSASSASASAANLQASSSLLGGSKRTHNATLSSHASSATLQLPSAPIAHERQPSDRPHDAKRMRADASQA